jgi:hypothetical protein
MRTLILLFSLNLVPLARAAPAAPIPPSSSAGSTLMMTTPTRALFGRTADIEAAGAFGMVAVGARQAVATPPPCVPRSPEPSEEEERIVFNKFVNAFLVKKNLTDAFSYVDDGYIVRGLPFSAAAAAAFYFLFLVLVLSLHMGVSAGRAGQREKVLGGGRLHIEPQSIFFAVHCIRQRSSKSLFFLLHPQVSQTGQLTATKQNHEAGIAGNGPDAALDALAAVWPRVQIKVLSSQYGNKQGSVKYQITGREPSPEMITDTYRLSGGCIVEHWEKTGSKFTA